MSAEQPTVHEYAMGQSIGESVVALNTIPADSDDIVWREAVSAKGETFQIGSRAPAGSNDVELAARAQGIADGGPTASFSSDSTDSNVWSVGWPVGDGNWKWPGKKIFDELDIARYCHKKNPGKLNVYDYILYVNTNATRQYYFRDESGDSYGLWCYVETDHYVRFNSKRPTIVQITLTKPNSN
ncbi:hypothetical protein DFP72DRAFT_420316 [Ephemerocybe angulata]|uniref:Uncharacterized protein n=1 Tax=Ephemerocybe angulata TaxID=980116 RepID=A0A8H6IHM0_9AGAR|nr:hypothetical protein DFP72DRAFT_420316 [Tulosesus angulatus]